MQRKDHPSLPTRYFCLQLKYSLQAVLFLSRQWRQSARSFTVLKSITLIYEPGMASLLQLAPPKTIGMTFSSPVMTIKPQIRALRLKIYDYRKSSIKPPSQISPSTPFRGRKLLSLPLSFNPPPPGPSLILHNKITKIWSDSVLLTHMLEVQTCFDLWLQDL